MESNIPSQPTPSITPEIQSPVTQSIPPSPSSSSNKTKYVLLGLLILLIITAVGGAYYLGVAKQQSAVQKNNHPITATIKPSPTSTPSPDLTENWKTYSDSNNHFSFKYPQEWIIKGNNIEEQVGNTAGNNTLTQKGVSVNVYENAGNLTALEFLDTIFYKDYTGGSKVLKDAYMKSYEGNINPNATIKNGEIVYVSEGGDLPYIKPITVDGRQETYIDVLITPPGSNGNGVWISLGKNAVLLRGYPSADYKNQQQIFNQILSTFKFTQ